MIDSQKVLNKEQQKAVGHNEGPLLIIAGAGTGKTTVVTERIKHLIVNSLAKPSEILGLTFTEKAAKEMQDRVDEALPLGYTQMWISTFHSFCDSFLRDEALHIGYDAHFSLMSEAETIQLLRKNLFSFDLKYFRPLGNPHKFLSALLVHFSRLQDENITPEEYLKWVKKIKKTKEKYQELEVEKWEELARAYKVYEELKVRESVMDYGDLIVKTLLVLNTRPNILEKYQAQFKYILVDEFQDTNFAQNELINLLANKHQNITVVGDDDQSIYKFRGAAISNILQFRKRFPKAKTVVLNQNYRSYQEILDSAYTLIQNNNPDRLEVAEKVDKRLVSTTKDKEPINRVQLIHTDRVENEAESVTKKIIELVIDEKKYSFGDIAILVRANNHADSFMRSMQRRGVPYQFLGPGRLFRQPEILDLISYLKVLRNFEDDLQFYRVLSLDFFEINMLDLIKLANFARKNNMSLFEAIGKIDELNLEDDSKVLIQKIVDYIKSQIPQTKKLTGGQLIYNFLEEFELLPEILNPEELQAQKIAQNISRFFDKIKAYESAHLEARLNDLVDWIDLASELGEAPLSGDTDWASVDAVNILTIHSSKGLEFPVVFLVNLVSERFPSRARRETLPIPEDLIQEVLPSGDFHLQEERRLFYVGMTRARDLLFLTGADFYGDGKRAKKLSQFIFESLGAKATANKEQTFKAEQLSLLDYAPTGKILETEKVSSIHIDYLSYSQMETFKTCPLHYKLKYILGLSTPATSAQSFGVSIHGALKDFYLLVKSGETAAEGLLLKNLEKNWITQGYHNKKHQSHAFVEATNYLKSFYKKQFDKKVNTVALEQPFIIDLKQGSKPLKIGGKIDRVDLLADGKIEIIDYKTGSTIPTQKEVDKNMQLTIYALAATEVKQLPFDKKPEDILLSLYFFETNEKISTTRTQTQLDQVKEEILALRDEIEKSDFKCSNDFFCQNCEFAMFCNSN